MKRYNILWLLSGIFLLNSCNILEKASKHGFDSGNYSYKTKTGNIKKVYLDISGDKITAYPVETENPEGKDSFEISLLPGDSLCECPTKFSKKSLDIDITSVLLKFRPGTQGLPAQLTADFNAALYTGWRHDNYFIKSRVDRKKLNHYDIINRGFDFGLFAGPGTTLVGPFSTRDALAEEYNGMIIQYGIAGFVESPLASFGISAGYDYLLSHDRKTWIYHHRLWFGFIVGIALN